MPHPSIRTRPGFTVMEITAVITIASLLALAAIPAMSRFDQASRAAGAAEAARMLAYARERASASGFPVGVRFEAGTHTAALLTIGADDRPEPLVDPFGVPSRAVALREVYRTQIARVSIPADGASAGATDTTTLWFDHRGTPHARTTSGVHAGDLTSDATVEFIDASAVIVRARSGLVEGP